MRRRTAGKAKFFGTRHLSFRDYGAYFRCEYPLNEDNAVDDCVRETSDSLAATYVRNNYIAGFDGIRALAVIAVVLTHAGAYGHLQSLGLLSSRVFPIVHGGTIAAVSTRVASLKAVDRPWSAMSISGVTELVFRPV